MVMGMMIMTTSPTGRAKNRFVCDRRFVSVINGGPKQSPNSNMK